MTEQKKVNSNTKTATAMALRRKAISEESHAAVLAGEMTLQAAKDAGPNTGPEGPVGPAPKTVSKNDRTPTKTPCLCGCGEPVARTFKAGHDMVMFRVAREHLTEGRELTKEQAAYLETSGKMGRVKDKLAEEQATRDAKS